MRKNGAGSHAPGPAVRCSLLESKVRAIVMIVADIISEQTTQVALTQSDHVIQQVTPAAFNPTLRNSILPRTPQRCADTFDFHRSDRGGDLRPILGIPIENEKPASGPIWEGLPQLLDDPQTGGMPRHVEI